MCTQETKVLFQLNKWSDLVTITDHANIEARVQLVVGYGATCMLSTAIFSILHIICHRSCCHCLCSLENKCAMYVLSILDIEAVLCLMQWSYVLCVHCTAPVAPLQVKWCVVWLCAKDDETFKAF
jgi:hypothetical protein